MLGSAEKDRPDLAIEVVWTRGGLRKLEIYRRLGVREVWIWQRPNAIEVHRLGDGGYQRIVGTELFPGLDVARLAGFLERPSQSQAVRELRAAMRAG